MVAFLHLTVCVTLTFKIGAWFLLVKCRLDIPNTSVKFYRNPFMQYKSYDPQKKKNSDAQTDGQMDGSI